MPACHHIARRIKVVPLASNYFPVGFRITSIAVAIPPAASIQDPFSFLFYLPRNPCSTCIYIIVPNPGIGCHCSGRYKVIAFPTYPMPACHHIACCIKVVPLASNNFPVGFRITSIAVAIPPSSSIQDPFSFLFYLPRNPRATCIYIIVPYPGIRCHCSGSGKIVTFTVNPLPAC